MSKNTQPFDPNERLPQGSTIALVSKTIVFTRKERLQFILPESLLLVLITEEELGLASLLESKFHIQAEPIVDGLWQYLDKVERVPRRCHYTPKPSASYERLASEVSRLTGITDVCDMMPVHFLMGLFSLSGSHAKAILDAFVPKPKRDKIIEEYTDVCNELSTAIPFPEGFCPEDFRAPTDTADLRSPSEPPDFDTDFSEPYEDERDEACRRIDEDGAYTSAQFAGRADEVDRSIITLLKSKRGNVVYVGERGVGKTSMVAGLIQAKSRFSKKSRFGSARFYKLNPSAIVTGVSYADEIENHVADIIDDIEREDCMAVIFADNMGDLMPQNQNDNTPDTLRLLTSLIDGKDIHLITTASFEQFKRLATHNSAVDKNFTRIDIVEPPLDPDGRNMVKAGALDLLKFYEMQDVCPDSVIDHVTETAVSSYTKDIAMPGRALDLLDSVCAFYQMERSVKRTKEPPAISTSTVDRLLKSLGYDAIVNSVGNEDRLKQLEPSLLAKIFGQDEAVHMVSESVLLAKAGLSDDTKPLAAYLFVGPTGVGKTELAKELASQLGVKLVRFDMSEYSEQHTVSKLVGSPAGYIGYDDGGLLTDAVRKSPNCVLLFDEIEKAHTAVFNILLQVLDYAQLTDNKGQKADFSGTIIIMTSNAGARFATGRGLGFGSKQEKSEAMGAELKRVFAPEFLNRLTQIISFHDMSISMAERILDRKLGELNALLEKKRGVTFSLSDEARKALISAGFSALYGAREMDRAIGRLLKPALMQALLFSKAGASASKLQVNKADDGKLVVE